MGLYSISGFLTICLVCYLFYRLRQRQRSQTSTMANVALLFLLVLGIIGLFYKILEGVNYIVVGIIMIWVCSTSRHS